MKKIKPIKYDLMLEGSYHSSVKTYRKAMAWKRRSEKQGWNVRIEAIYLTCVGEMGAVS